MNNLSFGRHLQLARKEKKLTVKELASFTNISARSIQQIECGNRSTSLPVLIQFCNALDITPQYLLSGDLNQSLSEKESEYTKIMDTILRLPKREYLLLEDMIHLLIEHKHR